MSDVERRGSKALNDFSEGTTVKHLQELGVQNVETAFDNGQEMSKKGEPVEAEISWMRLGHPEIDGFEDVPDLECKLYIPKRNYNSELILFTPGYPGGNAGRFETLYAKAFVDAGYAFCTVRHNGTSLTKGADTLEVLNSKKRMDIAQQCGEHHIGGTRGEGYSPAEVAKETINPLLNLYKSFSKVHLVGHSLGVSASYNALRRTAHMEDVMDKVGNVVSIAGWQGDTSENEEGIWDGMKMKGKELMDLEVAHAAEDDVNVCSREAFEAGMKEVAAANAEMKAPDHVNNVFIFTPEDPILAGPDKSAPRLETDTYVTGYGPDTTRKLIVRDETGLGEKKAHSMRWIYPGNILRALKVEIPTTGEDRGPLYIVVRKDIITRRKKDGTVEREWIKHEPVSRPYTSEPASRYGDSG